MGVAGGDEGVVRGDEGVVIGDLSSGSVLA